MGMHKITLLIECDHKRRTTNCYCLLALQELSKESNLVYKVGRLECQASSPTSVAWHSKRV